eukprot:1137997-Pelagomonas_calceolata.AAC.3
MFRFNLKGHGPEGITELSMNCAASSKASQEVSRKGLPSRLTQRTSLKGCACRGVTLNNPAFGNGVCAFIARNSNRGCDLDHAGSEGLGIMFVFWFNGVQKAYQWRCESDPGRWHHAVTLNHGYC